jgi:hypothetical protein
MKLKMDSNGVMESIVAVQKVLLLTISTNRQLTAGREEDRES